ncbi:MAG: hypothetical protein ABIS17_12975 [Casimicrobiaceae bacterium]
MAPAARIANGILERETWARERLAVHAGRTFVVVCGPVVAVLRVDDTGLLTDGALADGAPDLRLSLPPWSVPGLLADPTRWDARVTAQGDTALATTLRELAHTVPMWIEQFASRWLGPIVGQRVAGAGRGLLGFPGHAMQRLGESVVSYLKDETGTLASGEEARVFAAQTALITQRTETVAARLAALESRITPG